MIVKERSDLWQLHLFKCGQLCFTSSQIAGFFYHQYLWKKSSDILGKISGKVAPVLVGHFGHGHLSFLFNQIAGFYDHQFLWKDSIDIKFFHENSHQGVLAYLRLQLGVATCAFHPIRLPDSSISNICGKNQTISLIFCMDIIIEGTGHLRITPLVGCDQWSNWFSGFFDDQYFWKESIDVFVWPLSIYLSFLFISLHLLPNLAELRESI